MSTSHQGHSGRVRNRLATSTSPYLQQHADNPVDWWPWCPEALELARSTDRPIVLSIGYSACHWCHVMAHESFADPSTAELMNAGFVNIKVDREERPDLDKIYQRAHQLLTERSGGWPLTLFLTPSDQTPFFAGTYFPPEPRHGLPAFKQVLQGVERAYRGQQTVIATQNARLTAALRQLEPRPAAELPTPRAIDEAVQRLAASFDTEHGGFGGAPKFPHPTNLELLLRRVARTQDLIRPKSEDHPAAGLDDHNVAPDALGMAEFTLERMCRGGLQDQLGGGFYRYSVDRAWMIPHFEKMLYDNGTLLSLCCDLYALTNAPLFRESATMTADWVMREMQLPAGGYSSSLDADSEGHEGQYYIWTRTQVESLLTPAEYQVFAAVYGLDRPANFESAWHLHGDRLPEAVAAEQRLEHATVEALLRSARATLAVARERRIHPDRDDKVLTSWNALMIKALARAARILERPDYLESAEQALAFIRLTLWREGRLLATCKDGVAHLNAYLDDYAFLLDALLELLQTRWSSADLAFAIDLAEVLLEQFQDPLEGGFWFTARDHEALMHRPKPLSDEATPAGNGVAAVALQRLGHLIGEPRYLTAAAMTLRLAADSIARMPEAHATLLMALEESHSPPEILVIRATDKRLEHWRREAQRGHRPHRIVVAIPADLTETLPGTLGAMQPGERPRLYRCRGTHCEPPIESLDDLRTG
ncbi:thioredoxin domain-containing protein [Thiocapsa imhoffii]|uniref:Thioredoxin domain-containing protein n=1 Tax=Thiocapsa imhoffii TaxID=382777 RepID=A0A9X0WIM5_9GAMM|nr:thioredoxin domain-containing protein [Thiocapsa imhoffii]MBK1645253.1 thioredoxin domain-containing protein [Thiocapsa imhoffii]